MKIEFMTSIAVVAADPRESRKLYVDALGLPLVGHGPGEDVYYSSDQVAGTKHFGVWPLSEAATACFGTADWPSDVPVPQASLEFEVKDVAAVEAAARELEAAGYSLLHGVREEPWGQTVVRLLSIEGSIVGISYAPTLHE